MILNGNQRGGAKNLALHLMKEENERVEVHEIRGFVADNLLGAFQESHAISRATQCKQHMYSLSLSPPPSADVSVKDFEAAINQVEKHLGLNQQPRVIVFHEKRGQDGKLRRHAHAVWCRIDTDKMKAVQLSFSHKKLREVSRQLFVTHNWNMPDGLKDSKDRDPRNFTLAEWQQAKRAGKNAKELKALFQDCWALSDSKTAFANALLQQGLVLAQGKRGHVAVDYQGEIYPISRWAGLKAKAVRERLGMVDGLPSVEQAQVVAAKIVTDRLQVLKAQEQQVVASKREKGLIRTNRHRAKQARVAAGLRTGHTKRQASEEVIRHARIRKGVLGFVDRLTGKRKRTIADNAAEATAMQGRDQFEMEVLEDKHHRDLQQHVKEIEATQVPHNEAVRELDADIAWLSGPPELERDVHDQREEDERNRKSCNYSRDGPGLRR